MTSETPYRLPNPNELNEQSRLDLQHQIWLLSFNGDLKAPELPPDFKPKTALDIGCGSGAWAVSFALEHPDARVVALDINPPTIADAPSNLSVLPEKIDAQQEDQWPQGQTFDYIHLRMIHLAIKDWHNMFRICWKHLSPGGWIEINDSQNPWGAENIAANAETSLFIRFGYLLKQGEALKGVDIAVSSHHVDRLKLQGFTNVSQTTIKWPVNGEWPQDERLKQIGRMTGDNFKQFSKYGPIVLNSSLKIDTARATDFCERMLEEIQSDREMHYYVPQAVTIAQKPQNT